MIWCSKNNVVLCRFLWRSSRNTFEALIAVDTNTTLKMGRIRKAKRVGLQYSLGLLTFGQVANPGEEYSNSVFSITAGYRFPLNK